MAQLVFTGLLALLLCACLCEGERAENRQSGSYVPGKILPAEVDLLEFPLNLEYLEAEFFLFGSLGYGLDKAAPELPEGGPAPLGAKKAKLDPVTYNIILEFSYQEVGRLRAIKATVKGFPRPQLDLSAKVFSNAVDAAFETKLNPPFDPYANSVNYLLASYLIPYVGLTGYVGTNPNLHSKLQSDELSVAYARTPAEILRIVYSSGNESVPGGIFPHGGNGRIARSYLKCAG